jgi:hypothetical protein
VNGHAAHITKTSPTTATYKVTFSESTEPASQWVGETCRVGDDRDRDVTGRARNARPRDALGRPLPYGAQGVPRQPEGLVRTAEQTLEEAQQLLDAERPFHAHEVFEDAWKAARGGADAGLWKALAQLAVGYTHQLRGNPAGADALLRRAADALGPYASAPPHNIDIDALVAWAQDPDRTLPRLRKSATNQPPR